jgi:hypothetical protein
MKPCARRDPKIGKKNSRVLWCPNFSQSSECICWRTYEGIQKQMANNSLTLPTRIGSVVTHFQLPPYEFHWANRQARDIANSANSQGTWFFSKEKLHGSTQRLLKIIPYRQRREGVVAYLWLSLCVGLHQAFREFLLLREYGGGAFDPAEYLSSWAWTYLHIRLICVSIGFLWFCSLYYYLLKK